MKRSFNAYFANYGEGLRDITSRVKNGMPRADAKPEAGWKSVPKMNATTTAVGSSLQPLAEIDTTTSPSVYREKTVSAQPQSFELLISRPQGLARHNADLSSFLSFPSPSSVKRTHGISFTALLSKGNEEGGKLDAFLRTVSVNLAQNEEQRDESPQEEGDVPMQKEEEAEPACEIEEVEQFEAVASEEVEIPCPQIEVPLNTIEEPQKSPSPVRVRRAEPKFESTPTYAPSILERSRKLNRGEKIDSLLYKDALRRQEQQSFNAKLKEAQSTSNDYWTVSSSTEQAASIRFAKDFARSWPSPNAMLDHSGFIILLTRLGFISMKPDNEILRLVEHAWKIVQGSAKGIVSRQSLLVFLAAICGLTMPRGERAEETAAAMARDAGDSPSEGLSVDTPKIKQTEAQSEVFGLEKVREIHRLFNSLYRCRLSRAEPRSESLGHGLSLQQPRRRELSEQSRGLARQKREKVLSQARSLLQANGLDVPEHVSVVDLLRIQAVLKAEEKKQLVARADEEKFRECTFRPVTTDVRRGLRAAKTEEDETHDGPSRTIELYNLARVRPQRRNREEDEIALERAREEYTFAPKVSSRAPLVQSSTEIPPRGIEKAVARLREARKERERCEKMKERGIITTESVKGFVCGVERNSKHKPVFSETRDKAHKLRKAGAAKGKSSVTTSLYARSREQWRSLCADRGPATMPTAGSEDEPDSERVTLVVVDINLPDKQQQRVVVKEGDCIPTIAANFGLKFGLQPAMITQLRETLESQLAAYYAAKN
eukprot:TRINITY_DN10471_c0_g2_i1.p1 TRINITY_DN10471_c0_g2~~TRINITY_DN10471_c0_g2_i1.p1  ORF type:complete len:772 (+),score=166.86 TRINITY_DN10471_c0_g2_i1:37-2352(+)